MYIQINGIICQKTYEMNFYEMPNNDITQVDKKIIPYQDILCARFPYQTFSISGKQKGFEDSIGTLFFDISKIVREKNPKVIFIKNVKNFAIHYGEKPYTLSKAL